MGTIFSQVVAVAPLLGMVLVVAAILGVFIKVGGNMLSRNLILSNEGGALRCDLCFWYLDRV